MNKEKFGFCENDAISHKIYNLVANRLLGVEQLSKINRRYDDMRANFNKYPKDYSNNTIEEWVFSAGLEPFTPKGWDRCYSDTTAVPIPITHPDFIDLSRRTDKKGAIGLDFPTWFFKSPDAPFILIVSQDPLRSAKWYGDKEDENFICRDSVVSSPFGLHDAHHREKGNGGKRMWLLVRELLDRGYNVYLTDCRKFFVYSHSESDAYTTPAKMNLYRNILKEEIAVIDPKLIVTLGHSADKSCRTLLGDDSRLSGYIPHFCGTAGHKIKEFFGLESKTDIDELAKLYADHIETLVKK